MIDTSPMSEPMEGFRVQYTVHPVSKVDLQHGSKQFQQMILDRPEMRGFIVPGDVAYEWVAKQFAGEGIGCRIFWENDEPSNGEAGENRFIDEERVGVIRIARRDKKNLARDAELQWVTAIYELNNIRNEPYFKTAWQSSLTGKMSRADWIATNMRLEFKALSETRAFYRKIWRPLMMKRGKMTRGFFWRDELPEGYRTWIRTDDARQYAKYWNDCFPRSAK